MGKKLSDEHPGVVVAAVVVVFMLLIYFDSVRSWTGCMQRNVAEMGVSEAEEWCEQGGRPAFF